MKYVKPATSLIADSLEQYGAGAMIGMPMTRLWAERLYEENPLGWDGVGPKVEQAYKLAIDRLREQEGRIQALEAWQDRILEVMQTLRPTDRAAENGMGWRLFCLDAREKYRAAMGYVAEGIVQRDRKRAEESNLT